MVNRSIRKGPGTTNANFISDRSGFKYSMRDAVIEPGTGYLVHKSESDGRFNLVDHPANHVADYLQVGDPYPVENARPDRNWVIQEQSQGRVRTGSLSDMVGAGYVTLTGIPLLTEDGQQLETESGEGIFL